MSSDELPAELQIEHQQQLDYGAVMQGRVQKAITVLTTKRAQYEVSDIKRTMVSLSTGQDECYENTGTHAYRAAAENSVPIVYDCPADSYQSGADKGRVAIAGYEPIFAAAGEDESDQEPEIVTDGGTTMKHSAPCERQEDRRPADCDCLPTFNDLPCWPCYRDGFRVPNPDAKLDR
jgi:hypothetical protein